MTDPNNIDISCVAGWLRGRIATPDHSSGSQELVAGLDWRCRLDEVSSYQSTLPGIVMVITMAHGADFPTMLVGSLETMDRIMERAVMNIEEVERDPRRSTTVDGRPILHAVSPNEEDI